MENNPVAQNHCVVRKEQREAGGGGIVWDAVFRLSGNVEMWGLQTHR